MKNTYIKTLPEFGRCVMAMRDIKAGEVVEACDILVLSPEDTVVVNTTGLQYYTFKYNDTQDCIVLGHGELYNHSDEPNVSFTTISHKNDNRPQMRFTAIKDISKHEQLFIDYGSDVAVNTKEYVDKNLI